MDTIRNYVDMMFRDLPKTKEVIDMKMNILDNMEDKYNELIQEGKTENEAIGAVISQFGNIDELKEELGSSAEPTDEKPASALPYRDDEAVHSYLQAKSKTAVQIGFATMICILSVIPPCFDMLGDLGTILFFMMVAVGVAVFIITGMQYSEFEEFEKQPFQIREGLKTQLQQEYQTFRSRYSVATATGVVLCILSPIAYLIVENGFIFFWSDTSRFLRDLADGLACASLFIFVAIAVFLFIRMGIRNSAYEFILKNEKKQKEKAQEEEEDHLYGIIMPLAAVIYLMLGFCFSWWHPGWIIFPLAVVLVNCIKYVKRDRV